jgi:hypothetical protein
MISWVRLPYTTHFYLGTLIFIVILHSSSLLISISSAGHDISVASFPNLSSLVIFSSLFLIFYLFMMLIISLRLGGLIPLVVDLVATVNALPSNFLSIRDDLFAELPKIEPSSGLPDSALQDSGTSGSGVGLYSPEDSTGLLALASTQADHDPTLPHDSKQLGPDISSTDNLYPAIALGSTSEPWGLSLSDNTLGPSESSSNQPTIASSTDLFAGDNPGGSSSIESFNGDNPDGTNPILAYTSPDILPSDDIFGAGDGSTSDLVDSTEDSSFSDQGNGEDLLLALGKNSGVDRGTNTAPTCSGRKTPACCSTKQPGGVSLDQKSGCVSCTCTFLGVYDMFRRKTWA